jgi:hypothetical protein
MNRLQTKTPEQLQLETDRFFGQLEKRILMRLHEEAEDPEGRERLIRSTGIHDAHLIDELGLTQQQMTSVAQAAGGHLGFGKVSAKEKAIIHQVVESMKRQQQKS